MKKSTEEREKKEEKRRLVKFYQRMDTPPFNPKFKLALPERCYEASFDKLKDDPTVNRYTTGNPSANEVARLARILFPH